MRSDVVVVGAGPAGSVTALLLARAGLEVVLLDRSSFPRAKACGDCISPGANPLLRRIGVWDEVIAAQPALLSGWRLTAGNGAAFAAGFDAPGPAERSIAMPRAQLDAILLHAATRAGVQVHTGVRVRGLVRTATGSVVGVASDYGPIEARLTIGADGLRSRVARSLGAYARPPRLRKVSFTAHLRGATTEPIGEMHTRGTACLGVAPLDDSSSPLCNVTLVLDTADARGTGAHDIMRRGLRALGRSDLAESIGDHDEILASGPFDWPTRRIVFDGAALVGDAAGYFDPFTGQGIYQAIAGAELLAEHASCALRDLRPTARALQVYATRHHALIAPARRIQRVIDFVCARPALAEAVFAGLGRSDKAARRLVAVTGDLRPARDLLAPPVLTRLIAASIASLIL